MHMTVFGNVCIHCPAVQIGHILLTNNRHLKGRREQEDLDDCIGERPMHCPAVQIGVIAFAICRFFPRAQRGPRAMSEKAGQPLH
jgi:hypothetical protein